MTDAQLQAGAALCRKLMMDHSLTEMDVVGHRDLAATLCPGKNFRMKEMFSIIASTATANPGDIVMYTLQAGAFSKRQNAESLRDKLRKQGYEDAFITQRTISNLKL